MQVEIVNSAALISYPMYCTVQRVLTAWHVQQYSFYPQSHTARNVKQISSVIINKATGHAICTDKSWCLSLSRSLMVNYESNRHHVGGSRSCRRNGALGWRARPEQKPFTSTWQPLPVLKRIVWASALLENSQRRLRNKKYSYAHV